MASQRVSLTHSVGGTYNGHGRCDSAGGHGQGSVGDVCLPTDEKQYTVVSPEAYLRCAEERVLDAQRLHEAGRYGAAHYVAGVAVECVLRAYWGRRNPGKFYAGHALRRLCNEAPFFDYLPNTDETQVAARAALGVVEARWLNSHRFRDEVGLRRWLQEDVGLDPRVGKAKALRYSSEQIVEAAVEIIVHGRQSWRRQPHGLG